MVVTEPDPPAPAVAIGVPLVVVVVVVAPAQVHAPKVSVVELHAFSPTVPPEQLHALTSPTEHDSETVFTTQLEIKAAAPRPETSRVKNRRMLFIGGS
ncbi:MAG TPA: hypothetical protein VJT73_02375 [Polyangiaceae bacterium]|nr:hypothetical protein [Polyangiaceae bacterium]